MLKTWKYAIPIAVILWSLMGVFSCTLHYVKACIAVTYSGSGPLLITLTAGLIKLGGYKWLRLSIGLLSASVVNVALKILIDAPRPPMEEWIVMAEGPGFPSGHAAITAAFWTIVYFGTKSRALLIAGIAHIVSISLSRVELGVHYPVDVIGGVLQGSIVSYTTLLFINKFNIYKIEYYITIILFIMSIILFILNPSLKTSAFLSVVSIILLILLYRVEVNPVRSSHSNV